MTQYLDASALLTIYLEEEAADRTEAALAADPFWMTGRHTRIEVRRNLARTLRGRALKSARDAFEGDWRRTNIVELDAGLIDRAAAVAEQTNVRTLDALHIAAALTVGVTTFVTLDRRQARAARALGLAVARL